MSKVWRDHLLNILTAIAHLRSSLCSHRINTGSADHIVDALEVDKTISVRKTIRFLCRLID
ncbi:MAG TPA: hypothetical protein VFV86_10790 [Nitrososphaeraceae archaeon]|nr:hypothetical protein [Nitrososphaeraceae archaeon]